MRTTQAQNLGLSNKELGHRFAQCVTFIGLSLILVLAFKFSMCRMHKDVSVFINIFNARCFHMLSQQGCGRLKRSYSSFLVMNT